MNWDKALFLHTGWTSRYDGTEAPEGGHAYLKRSVGVEAENFKPVDGWCYGYAPVGRTSQGRQSAAIPKGQRTLKIEKLGAARTQAKVDGVTIVWTARHPNNGPVIVGLYEEATAFRFMPADEGDKFFIAKARVENCHLVPEGLRDFEVPHKRQGFPGMAAAWFPGPRQDGLARDFLAAVVQYLPTLRRYTHEG
jgi:hypothetical protein